MNKHRGRIEVLFSTSRVFTNHRFTFVNRLPGPGRAGPGPATKQVLGGSWVVISRVISRVTILTTHIRGLTTPLITTHEPPSSINYLSRYVLKAVTV